MDMQDTRKVAVILVESGVQDQEFWYPYYRLQEAGFKVIVVGPCLGSNRYHGKYGPLPDADLAHSQLRIGAPDAPDADVIIVPGGWECPEKLRMNQDVLDYLMQQYQRGAVVGAICHGPWVLISAGMVRGKKMTCYKGMKDDLINAGAEYADVAAVSCQGIVTSPHYKNNPQFMEMLFSVVSIKLCSDDGLYKRLNGETSIFTPGAK